MCEAEIVACSHLGISGTVQCADKQQRSGDTETQDSSPPRLLLTVTYRNWIGKTRNGYKQGAFSEELRVRHVKSAASV